MEITIHHVFQGPVLRFLDALTGGLATAVTQSAPTTESPVAEAPVEEPKPEPKAKRARAKKDETEAPVSAPVETPVAEVPQQAEPASSLEDADDLLGEEAKPEKSKLTIDDFRRVCKTICEQGKESKEKLIETLSQWGVKQIPTIPPEKFDVIWADLKKTFPGIKFE